MTCSWHSRLLFSAFLFACGDDDGGDVDDGADDDASGDERPASDDFAPGEDDDASGSNSGGSTGGTAADDAASADDAADAASSSGADDGAGGCVEVGQACTTADFCSTWICVCNAGATEFMTVGTCESGTCPTNGTSACEPICANSGGVAMATDGGCR